MNRIVKRGGMGAAAVLLSLLGTGVVMPAASAAPTADTAPTAAAAPAGRAPETTLALPAPTGPYPVGVTELHLVDDDRADQWVPERRRELMVSLWFPAVSTRGAADRYVSAEESRLILTRIGAAGIPLDTLSRVRTHARTGVRALRTARGLPLVVLSPGFSFPRSSLTALAEDLASRGYVVAGVDHTFEAAAVTFPDGRITECPVCTLLEEGRVEGPT